MPPVGDWQVTPLRRRGIAFPADVHRKPGRPAWCEAALSLWMSSTVSTDGHERPAVADFVSGAIGGAGAS